MMKKRLLALLLVLALAACLFAGCGSQETPAAETTPAAESEPAAEPTAEPAAEPAAAPAAAPAAEPAPEGGAPEGGNAIVGSQGEITEAMTSAEMAELVGATNSNDIAAAVAAVKAGDYTSAGGIHYPLTDDGSGLVTFWFPFGFGWESYMDSWNEQRILPYVKEAVGVDILFDCVSQSAATEQFQLYIAGGDYSDIMQPGDYYTGGLGQAYEDEVIIDLTDLMPTNSPDYWAHLMSLDEDTIDGVKTDKKMLGYVVIYNANWADGGNICRGDMAEAVGYVVENDVLQITTIDEFTDLVKKVYDQFGCDWTILTDADDGGVFNLGSNAFEGAIANISADSTSVGVSLTDGVISASACTDSFRRYAEWFHDLYEYGVFNPEFYVNTIDSGTGSSLAGSGEVFTWFSRADGTDGFLDYVDEANAGAYSAVIGPIYAYEGQVNEYPTSVSLVDNKQFVVTTSCEQVDLVMQYLNFGFTDGGYELYNWGTEGETFYIDEDGTYHYNDFVWNNPDGANFMMASAMSAMCQLPRFDEHAKLNDGYTTKQVTAQDMWTNTEGEDLHTIPTKAGLTTAESNSIINEVNDVLATLSEWGLKFYTGSLEINDANWADFQAALENSGINKVVETYQNAYDSYLRGERDDVEVASTGGGDDPGAGGPPPM